MNELIFQDDICRHCVVKIFLNVLGHLQGLLGEAFELVFEHVESIIDICLMLTQSLHYIIQFLVVVLKIFLSSLHYPLKAVQLIFDCPYI